jgi:hypothetical protein
MPEEKGHRQKSPQILSPKEESEQSSPNERLEHPTEVVHETISFARAIFNLPPHPFQGVMNAEHLNKLIEHEEKNEQRAFEDAKQLRKHTTCGSLFSVHYSSSSLHSSAWQIRPYSSKFWRVLHYLLAAWVQASE